jgi:D-beta-D-heptose 7-phosphate kinase/D-beta-D-heptose 1-phosphate adenosyltransferase
MAKTVCISGGFDPVHIGHLRMIRAAKNIAGVNGRLIIILNSDEWLRRKKGYVFMPFEERKEILMGFRGVDGISLVNDSDDTVCEALSRINPDIFANGGDRKEGNVPEDGVCNKLHIEMIYNVGGDKVQSSSKMAGRSERSRWRHE